MGRPSLNTEEVRQMLMHVADGMIASESLLTDADRAIGDGDHGVGIERGFRAARERVAEDRFENLAGVFLAVGTSLVSSMGGASGAVFGTLFRSGGKALGEATDWDSAGLATFLEAGLAGVMQRGGAKPGDKTLIDALEPAAARARALSGEALDVALAGSVEAAQAGKDKTRDMIATTGKARALGERSRGHPDPGAMSMSLILRFMQDYVEA